MKKSFLFVILFAFLTVPALGQSTQTFVHEFEDHKIYQRIGSAKSVTWVTTVKIKDRQCKRMFVSPVEITDNRIVFQGDTVWKIAKAKGGIEITFPNDKTVKYKPADTNPLQYCKGGRES